MSQCEPDHHDDAEGHRPSQISFKNLWEAIEVCSHFCTGPINVVDLVIHLLSQSS